MMFWFLSSGQSSAPHLQGIPSGSLRWRSWSWTASARANPWQAGQVTGSIVSALMLKSSE